ncbi:radical SAM family heme chaperone HemW [Wukongibacter baidiensis]|uniref:radical SAM family heme chaperone HemW n=1 Tax=Wukongibacter baidiensis TaxID=1723361 RepID=UPI003D7F6BD5
MKEIGLYLHIPFCIQKCKYCDFVSDRQNNETIDSYVEALKKEINMYSDRLSDYRVETIFIGGGTPSILETEKMDKIVKELFRNFNISKNVEFSIESNPGTLTKDKLKKYNDIGINRLSMGLQSFNNDVLKEIGRIHTKEDFIHNYDAAREAGCKNINIDLIYGLPNQDLKDWEHTLREVIKLNPEHISAYSLKIEEGTAFKRLFDENKLNLPGDEEDRKMYDLAIKLLEQHGIIQYEISNFSKKEYECKHNLIYWNNKEYLGLGVSAHSYMDSCRYANTGDINEYIRLMNEKKTAVISEEHKDEKDEIVETIFLGLRLNKGLDLEMFENRFKISIYDMYGEKIKSLVELGLLYEDKNHIRLTRYGMDVSNQVFIEFL